MNFAQILILFIVILISGNSVIRGVIDVLQIVANMILVGVISIFRILGVQV